MSKLALVGLVLVVTSCMTDFPELASEGDASSTGGSAGASSGGNSGLGGAVGGNGGNVGGNAGDASVGGSGGNGGTGGSGNSGGSGGVVDSGPDAELVPGLLGHWPFDDASGTTAVNVVAGNNATLPATGASWGTGVFGGGIALAGPASGISAPAWYDTAFPTTGTLTVWVKTKVVANDISSRSIFDAHDTNLDHLFIRRANGSPAIALQCAFQAKAAQYSFVKTVPITSDAWQLVAIGWSPSQGFCYIHGNMQPGPVTSGWSPTEQRFSLGTNLTGTLDDVRLYDHMLSVSELAKLLSESP